MNEYTSETKPLKSMFGVGLAIGALTNALCSTLLYAFTEAMAINTPAFSLWMNGDNEGQFI
jgi:hypothetical protein